MLSGQMIVGVLGALLVLQACAPVAESRGFFSCVKDYVAKKMLDNTPLKGDINGAIERARDKMIELKESGKLDGMDETLEEAEYYKILVQEIRELKQDIESKIDQENRPEQLQLERDECYNPDQFKDYAADWSPDQADDYDKAFNELQMMEDKLEQELAAYAKQEEEMGSAMTAEAKEKMSRRAKSMMKDILENEIKDVALAAVTAYLTGGSTLPVIIPFIKRVITDLTHILLQGSIDLLASMMGVDEEGNKLKSKEPTTQVVDSKAEAAAAAEPKGGAATGSKKRAAEAPAEDSKPEVEGEDERPAKKQQKLEA